jgi:hypothetical protein
MFGKDEAMRLGNKVGYEMLRSRKMQFEKTI